MKISFTQNPNPKGELHSHQTSHQVRVEESFSLGEGHGDFCLTAYGQTREEAHANLRQLALLMGRALDRVKGS